MHCRYIRQLPKFLQPHAEQLQKHREPEDGDEEAAALAEYHRSSGTRTDDRTDGRADAAGDGAGRSARAEAMARYGDEDDVSHVGLGAGGGAGAPSGLGRPLFKNGPRPRRKVRNPFCETLSSVSAESSFGSAVFTLGVLELRMGPVVPIGFCLLKHCL